jgi:putative transposase
MSHIGWSRAFTPVAHAPKGATPSDRSRAFTPVPLGSISGSTSKPIVYHNPPHLYVNDSAYIITASTMNKQKYLNNDMKKQILQKAMFKSVEELKYKMFAWVILENHYHILIEVADSKFLGKLTNRINGRSSYEINKLEKKKGRKIWYSYWDTCIRNENDFYTRFNYIHSNPVKHGCIDKLDDLASYEFSSYPYYLWTKGTEWCNDIFSRFPVIDFAVQYDDY